MIRLLEIYSITNDVTLAIAHSYTLEKKEQQTKIILQQN